MRGWKAPRLIYSSGRIAPLYWVRRVGREERKKLGGLRVRTASLGDWWLSNTLCACGARRGRSEASPLVRTTGTSGRTRISRGTADR